MNKAEFVNLVKATRSEWDELLAQVNDSLMLKKGVEGDWSAKDILAHVMWYERQMVQMLRSRDLIGSDLWELPVDDRNAEIHKEITGMSLQSVRKQSEEVFAELLQQLVALPDDAYGDSSQFQNMPTEWEPWEVIAENTFRHYLEHSESVRRLLEAESS